MDQEGTCWNMADKLVGCFRRPQLDTDIHSHLTRMLGERGRERSLIKRKIRGVSCVSLLRAGCTGRRGEAGAFPIDAYSLFLSSPSCFLSPASRKVENLQHDREQRHSTRKFVREIYRGKKFGPDHSLSSSFLPRGWNSISRRVGGTFLQRSSASSTEFSARFLTVSRLFKKSRAGAKKCRATKWKCTQVYENVPWMYKISMENYKLTIL